jgi:SAM-dependent methyltransferase
MSDPRADALVAGYASIARGYREQLSTELAGKPLDRAFLAAFAERCAGTIVEVGCGPGHVAKFLAECGGQVEGTDLSPAMIDEARAAFPDVRFVVADMFALPYADHSLAGIAAFYAIVHLRTSELVAPFREFRRVLSPTGLLAIAFHIGDEVVHVDELFGGKTDLDFVMHRPEAVIEALATAGFRIEARLDRAPYANVEHPTQRCYLLASPNGSLG